MKRQEIIDFIWAKVVKGNHFIVGPNDGLIVSPSIENIADWFIELQQKEPTTKS